MTTTTDIAKRMGIVSLAWPIFIETTLRMLLGVSDVFMLSGYSDNAVAAVGLTSQLMFFLMIVAMTAGNGGSILISQSNGASDTQRAADVGVISIVVGGAVGAILSLLTGLFAPNVIGLFGLDSKVALYATQYFAIAGGGFFGLSLSLTFAVILRCHGYSRTPMLVNLFTGVLNIVGNYCVLYSPFDLPVYGVKGVATATIISQFVGAFILWVNIRQKGIEIPLGRWFKIDLALYKKTIKLGAMSASEMLSYNLAQMTLIYIITQMGTASLTAYTYAMNIARFSFAFSLSVGQAAQIQTGYYVGKQWIAEITRKVQQYFLVSLLMSLLATLLIAGFRFDILGLFTDNNEIITLAATLLIVSIVLEMGRVFNLVFINALRGAGDMTYTVKVGIFSMWTIAVGMGYFLGLHIGLGVLGIWFANAADEWFRGLLMARRWRSGKWHLPSLVENQPIAA
uniref:MATE family efflux transporter n=1 Tax=Thaumasiovibrio occultus TaxID=1891184 RepID=UPI000B34E09F|nr:MATE family efflux transporter [Thaumasiovibrio occultus]